jgi:hypothetical protein
MRVVTLSLVHHLYIILPLSIIPLHQFVFTAIGNLGKNLINIVRSTGKDIISVMTGTGRDVINTVIGIGSHIVLIVMNIGIQVAQIAIGLQTDIIETVKLMPGVRRAGLISVENVEVWQEKRVKISVEGGL